MTTLRRDPSKALLAGFLALLTILIVQVGWWMADHFRYADTVEQRIGAMYRVEAAVIGEFLRGEMPAGLGRRMPYLAIDEAAREVHVRPEALAALERDTARRANRYFWEGSFFLVVLIGGMTVLTRTIRHDAELRKRQQNFLAAVSHEFKSPLASVRLAAETLVLRSQEPDTQRLGRRILDDGERLLRMVENLLDTARLEEGRRALTQQSVAVAAAVRAAIAEVAERAALHRIEIAVDVDEKLRLSVDPAALESMLRNLLDNAVKACVAGDGHAISVRARRAGGRVELSVADDGLGFPPEDAVMIFEKFHRLGNELRRTTAGTGLGLYIVKRLVELSGAAIRAASEGPGKGATFVISWPDRAAS